ncbi:MAG TPA: 23S rRNA (uracil(1939)-C(5))-methyltransferase RlmD [Bacillota bacterium]|nr:23S rRNA (uracil(1939)-C(5))-methyltransferase RlmD [Bacillota bacterium]HOL11128.1 23S rRNA (uracil(1939)-C(5))-methyltransferase RlmD [Bacillota bacterium]HPO98847.1 23S rRNA (uracil(1939)-C(5))-methyltransferase RlmD [Bacillota bacterium]
METVAVPVSINDVIELTIDNYGYEGEGIGSYQGFPIHVFGGLKGEKVLVKIVEVNKKHAKAVLSEILTLSSERVQPQCPIYGECTGCQLQHMDYQAQLTMKRQQVIDAVERIANFTNVLVHPTIGMNGMKKPWYYRNMVQYPVGGEAGKTPKIGFYQRDTGQIVTCQECLLQILSVNWITQKIKELSEIYQVTPYDEQTGTGLLRHVMIRMALKSGEVLVILITNGSEFEFGERFAEELIVSFPAIKGVVQNINPNKGRSIFGKDSRVLAGTDSISDEIGGFTYKISARSFFPINSGQAEVLSQKVLEYAALEGNEIVVDAYCGVGTLSLPLAKKAQLVYGIEVCPETIQDAAENAASNRVDNVKLLLGKADEMIAKLLEHDLKFEIAVVDPPKPGCELAVLQKIAAAGVRKIIYVSSNPGTLARDLKRLDELGYQTMEIQPIDMYPQTYQVQCVVRLEKKKEEGYLIG